MSEPGRCCEITRNDLRSAHQQLHRATLALLLALARIEGLEEALATVTAERDQLRGTVAPTQNQETAA